MDGLTARQYLATHRFRGKYGRYFGITPGAAYTDSVFGRIAWKPKGISSISRAVRAAQTVRNRFMRKAVKTLRRRIAFKKFHMKRAFPGGIGKRITSFL